MPKFTFVCPACGSQLRAKLEAEVSAVACECGHVFMADVTGKLTADGKKKKKKDKARHAPLSMALLEAADDATSSAVIAAFAASAPFLAFARAEMDGILARDAEDDEKLAQGISLAVAKGAVPPKEKLPLEPLTTIDVLGKSADDVAAAIVAALGDAPSKGCVLVLQGLSGTGKGTTVGKYSARPHTAPSPAPALRPRPPRATAPAPTRAPARRRPRADARAPARPPRLQQALPRASCWSNGNIFRSLTLLAVAYCESRGVPFSADALTPGLLRELIKCLRFERVGTAADGAPEFDVRIQGVGIDARVSQVANTLLKEPQVGRNIPTVARMTQGEVISFAAQCAEVRACGGRRRVATRLRLRSSSRADAFARTDPLIATFAHRRRCAPRA
jgi:hypothetical protein